MPAPAACPPISKFDNQKYTPPETLKTLLRNLPLLAGLSLIFIRPIVKRCSIKIIPKFNLDPNAKPRSKDFMISGGNG